MGSRALRWGVGTAVVGAILLLGSIHARLDWRVSHTSPDQVITLDQLVGMIVGGGLLIISLLIAIASWRAHRARLRSARRRRAWEHEAQDTPGGASA